MIPRIRKVKEWYEVSDPYTSDETTLQWIFDTYTDLMEHWYFPVKIPTSEGMPDEFEYKNLGITATDLADMYYTQYGENFLSVPLCKENDSYEKSIFTLGLKVHSIYLKNLQKYTKMLELGGYSYNPLYNVDGVEEYTYLENNGTTDLKITDGPVSGSNTVSTTNTKTGNISTNSNGTDGTNTHQITPFDSNTFVNESKDFGGTTETYNNVQDSATTTYNLKTERDSTYTHNNAKNKVNGSEVDYSGGEDNFGNTITGGDRYHHEKRKRYGNIGVTKTQELLAAERDNLKFSLIQEIFDDINEQLLVGIYFI